MPHHPDFYRERDDQIYRLFKPVDNSLPMLQREIAELFNISPVRVRVIVFRKTQQYKTLDESAGKIVRYIGGKPVLAYRE